MASKVPNATALRRFWSKVNTAGPVSAFRPDLGPCWQWKGAPSTYGYGRFRMGGTGSATCHAHAAAWELLVGPVPEGLHVDHLCRNRRCVNPAHLEPVTIAENLRRSQIQLSTLNAAKTECPLGHPYDAANTLASRGARYCKACRYPKTAAAARARRRMVDFG